MKYYCNMIGNLCRDVFIIPDDVPLEECIHPNFLPLYQGNEVPSYVGSNWTVDSQGLWSDPLGVAWPNGVPSGPTLFDPNYTGPWPPTEEQPEEPSETPEE